MRRLPKTERDPISTSGPSSLSMSPDGQFHRKTHPLQRKKLDEFTEGDVRRDLPRRFASAELNCHCHSSAA